MELSSFSENIVIVPFGRGGETVDLSVNIDAFTPEFFREVGRQSEAKLKALSAEEQRQKGKKKKAKTDGLEFFEREARALEIQREIHASLLANGVLKGWSVTKDGQPIEPTKELLMTRPPLLVEALWNACLNAAKTVKKKVDGETEETLESTPSGSRAPLALAPTG
jgi:hypothetical protein